MSVRERKPAPSHQDTVEPPAELDASHGRLSTFPELLSELERTPGLERTRLAARVNDVLIAMREPGHEAEEAELVMAALQSKILHPLIDADGRSCRKEAVETMLACGFPHALLLEPEDIRFARTFKPAGPRLEEDDANPRWTGWELTAQTTRRLGAGVIGLSHAASLVIEFLYPPRTGWWFYLLVLVAGLASAAALAFVRPRDLNIATFGALLVGIGLTGGLFALFTGAPQLLLAPVSLGVGLYVSIAHLGEARADPPRPGDWDYVENRRY